jgi:protease-4
MVKPMKALLRFAVLAALCWTCGAAAAADPTSKEGEKPVVAVIRLHGPLTEAPMDEMLSLFSGGTGTDLKSLVARLDKAREDKNVKAVVLTVEAFGAGFGQIEELRQALDGLRTAGKEVYAHADSMSSSDFALVSGATRVSLVPTGNLWLMGLYGEAPYVRGLLDKVGVKPDFLTCGDYKSAAEMFMRTGPSPQADEMQNWLLDSIFATQVQLIAEGRKVSTDKAKGWVDGGPYSANKAKEHGMIDAVEHRQELEALLREKFGEHVKIDTKYGKKSGPDLDFSTPLGIMKFYGELLGGPKKKTYKESVAVVYVEGPIIEGSGDASPFALAGGVAASTPIRRALDKAATDDTIKAVVLRVNSPGGSATASEIILDATKRVKAKKPLVVSMGDVAGSGGYYVACGADTIFADRATITGSIGVVAGKMVTTDLWNNVGISWKGYKRGANSSLLGSAEMFSPEERKHLQGWMDEIYDVFKGHVTTIRGARLKKPLDEMAGGRVYTGAQALELGLVDKLGTLQDAIKFAATEAKVEKYETRVVPDPKSFIELLLEGMNGDDEHADRLIKTPRVGGNGAAGLLDLALPYIRTLDPARSAAVTRLFVQLETLRRERIGVIMPELVIGTR